MRPRSTLVRYSGISILLLVLTVNAMVCYSAMRRLITHEGLVEHTQSVLLELEKIESLLKGAETGQRGRLYANNISYLTHIDAVWAEVYFHIDDLQRLTADSPFFQSRISELRTRSKAMLDQFVQTVDLRGYGKDTPGSVFSSPGEPEMEEILVLTGQMKDEETLVQHTRIEQSRQSARSAAWTFVIATLLAALTTIVFAIIVSRDMRQREAAAAALHAREEWLRTTLLSIGDAVIATDALGQVTFLNGIAEQLTGFSTEQAKGRPIADVFPIYDEKNGARAVDPVRKVVEQGTIIGLASQPVLRRGDGREFFIDHTAAPIRDNNRELIGVVLVFRDVTQQKQTEAVLRKSDRLATAGQMAAMIAHEINNPLSTVTNLLYLLSADLSLSKEARGYIGLAEEELQRVTRIANQTLTFYRESSATTPVVLSGMLEEVLSAYRKKIQARDVRVITAFEDSAVVEGFGGELRQVFANLISNALDAVDTRGVLRITLGRASHDGRQGAQVTVQDNGIGISPENLPRVFEPFFTTKRDVGTGLGLWVVKGLIEKHGGTIGVQSSTSSADHGTCFEIFLPLKAACAKAASAA